MADSHAKTTQTQTNIPYAIILAATQSGAIGLKGNLPWGHKLKKDMQFFKSQTCSSPSSSLNIVIMGRRTWESIPAKMRPLEQRINIIVTKDKLQQVQECVASLPDTHVATSLSHALQLTRDIPHNDVYVIGGSQLYDESLTSLSIPASTIYLTRVFSEFEADTRVVNIDTNKYQLVKAGPVEVENDVPHQFQEWRLKESNLEEMQYLNLIRRVLHEGNRKGDRTGTGTVSLFGAQMRFSLRNGIFPLLTSKRVFWRGVLEELIWLIKGQTDSKILAQKKVHIWDDNGSRTFLDKLGFTEREEGDLGPVYGFQWRHFGAVYKDCKTDYTGQGVDQLREIIDTIKKNPNDRRIIMNAWNPTDLNKMALPPCHVMCQFYVANGELSCQMYQRSCDLGLGVPFNIASYSLLTVMIAHLCNLKPGEFIHTLGDAHVYNNHIEPLQQQLARSPRPFPTLKIKRQVENIEDFQFEDFELSNYTPLETIKMQMAV